MIEKVLFDNYNGCNCYLYVLRGEGIEVGITDFGAAVQFIRLSAEKGITDVALGYPTIKERLDSGTYCGVTIGRVTNRIKNSRFSLNGKEYALTPNDGKNCNHGGINGFDKRFFSAGIKGDRLELSLESPDGDQGFSGNLKLCVEFGLRGKRLEVRFSAESDEDTVWAPTLHPYFNLDGENGGCVYDTLLQINSDKITVTDGEQISTGEERCVAGTPFDFTSLRKIGSCISKDGYDQNYVLKGEWAATAYSAISGIVMDVYTDLPGLQFYSGKFLKGKGKSVEYGAGYGFCLEPQYFPNAVNIEKFASPVLKAGIKKTHYIYYDFYFGK